ncbi:hypothetical protein IVA83_35020 [Bradyrhizobium sp. 143]|nr:hypothetical protein [Bradyrhizobium sp. 143]MCK1726120.1 hypothetical protein [Bradyrhizobium sp. 142]
MCRRRRTVGARGDTIIVSGGAGQSELARQLLADTIGQLVATTISREPVLLGSAMLGAVAWANTDASRLKPGLDGEGVLRMIKNHINSRPISSRASGEGGRSR